MGSNLSMAAEVRKRFATIESLAAAAELVQGLMAHPGWGVVMAIVDDEIGKIDRELDDTREPLGRAAYASKHGRRGGLKAIELAAHAIVREAEAELQRQRDKHESGAEHPVEA